MEYLGTDIPIKFPQIHAATGREVTPFLNVLVKAECLNGKEKLRLLNIIGVSCKVSDC